MQHKFQAMSRECCKNLRGYCKTGFLPNQYSNPPVKNPLIHHFQKKMNGFAFKILLNLAANKRLKKEKNLNNE